MSDSRWLWVIWAARGHLLEEWLRRATEPWQGERLVLYGDELKPEHLVELLGTADLLGRPRLVTVRRAERLGREGVLAALQALSSATDVRDRVFLVDGSPEGLLVSAVDSCPPLRATVEVVRLESPETLPGGPDLLAAELERLRIDAEPEARALLQAVAARHPDRLPAELQKLALYPERPLRAAAVRWLLASDLLESVELEAGPAAHGRTSLDDRRRFWAAEAALAGEAGRALRWMAALQREGIPAAWFFRELARQIMQLWGLAEQMEQRYGPPSAWPPRPPEDLVPARLPAAAYQRQYQLARRLGTRGLLELLERLVQADHETRRGSRPEHSLARLVMELANPNPGHQPASATRSGPAAPAGAD